MDFKKGDKVIYKVPAHELDYFHYEPKVHGEVEEVLEDEQLVAVNFGNSFIGHNCNIVDLPETCWLCVITNLEHAPADDHQKDVREYCLAACETPSEYYDQHYTTDIQPIEFMQAVMTHEELVGFLKGNIIKYVARCGRKDEPIKEATKIKRYAEWLVDVLDGATINPRF